MSKKTEEHILLARHKEMESKMNEISMKISNQSLAGLLPKEEKKKYEKLEKMSGADFQGKLDAILSGKVPAPISYENSDQSPLKGTAVQFLKNQWSTGMNYQPHVPAFIFKHLSSWLRCIWLGDYDGFMKHLEGKIN